MQENKDLLASFFRSCISFYNTKAWKLLGDHDAIRITIENDGSYCAFVTGASSDTQPGLSLIRVSDWTNDSVATNARSTDGADSDHAPAAIAHTLWLTFVSENEAPEWLRDARRTNKWPVASSAAFPTWFAIGDDNARRELNETEFRQLSMAVNVVTKFVATRRKQIQSKVPHMDVLSVPDDGNADMLALVQYPFDPNAVTGWIEYRIPPGERPHGNRAFEDIWNAALELPDAQTMFDRLVWSFFHSSDPAHIENEDEWDSANERFLAWGIFVYRRDGLTLAERALKQLVATRPADGLEVHQRIIKPRVGIFRVTGVQRNAGLQVVDVMRRDAFDVVDRTATRRLPVGDGLIGMLHPISDTQWILSPGVSRYPSIPEMMPQDYESSDATFAPAFEEMAFGANASWIQELPPEGVRDCYEEFAEAIAGTGEAIPTYEELAESIANAAQPSHVMQKFAERAWWTDAELNVALAFVVRAWNVTPRGELGGKSPDELSAGGGRLRTRPPVGRKR